MKNKIKMEEQKTSKKQKLVLLQQEHKKMTKRMRTVLNGLDKGLISLKAKSKNKFDSLSKNKEQLTH